MNKIDKIKQIVKKCKTSPSYFINNFCKIKHPNAGIIPFKLFGYQKSCLEQFTQNQFNIFSKTRQCFAAGTPVWTPCGPKPIEKLKIGDLVYTYDTKKYCVKVIPISNIFKNNIRDTVVVRTKTGHRARVTLDHKYLTTNGWVEAQNLTQNDIVIEINDHQRYFCASKSDAILLGYLITDGYYGSSTQSVHFTNTTWKYLLEYQKHFELKFGERLPIKKHDWNGKRRKKDAYRIYTYSKEIKSWLSDLGIMGHKSKTKIIPETVFSWDNKTVATLINRMFAGDGWYSGSGKNSANEAGIGSESILLLHQIKQLLTRFHIDSKVYPATKSSIAKLRIIGGRSFNNFVNYIGINGKNPRKTLTQGFIKNRIKGRILSIEPSHPTETYDLEIPPHNNFIADGVVVHNSGISTLSGAYALWMSMFFKSKTILIVSKRDRDAKEFLTRNIKFVYKYLPNWMKHVWHPAIDNEHEYGFSNGSKISSLPSGPDTLRANSSSLNIIDEAGFCPHMDEMWAGGYPCSRGDTLIQTEEGLVKIMELANPEGNQWQGLNLKVATDDGYKHCNGYYISGTHQTTIINTFLGFEFEGTNHHRLRVIDESGEYVWKHLSNIKLGDLVVSLPGQFSGKKRTLSHNLELTQELAEILGLYVGDGHLSTIRPKRFRICFDKQDQDTRDHVISKLNKILNNIIPTKAYGEEDGDNFWVRLNSSKFSQIMADNGLNSKKHAGDAEIPSLILKSSKEVLRSFLRGLFDSDGWCFPSSTSLQLGFATKSGKLAEQVQVVLHSLGIISRRVEITEHAEGRFSDEPYWKLTIYDAQNKIKFREQIGFMSSRKQNHLNNFVSESTNSIIEHPELVCEFADAAYKKMLGGKSFRFCQDKRKWNILKIRRKGRITIDLVKQLSGEFDLTDRLSQYVAKGYYFDVVTSIRSGKTETFDISVPNNNTYLANGIISHNTLQHGGCQISGSTILTTNGLEKLRNLGDVDGEEWQDISINVVTDTEIKESTKFYINNKTGNDQKQVETRIITTQKGFESECSMAHRYRIVRDGKYVWEYSPNIKVGDIMPIKVGGYPENNNDKTLTVPGEHKHKDNIKNLPANGADIVDVMCADCGLCNQLKASTLKMRVKRRNDNIYYCRSCGIRNSSKSTANKICMPDKIEPWFAEWLGLYMGDGWTSGYRVGINCDVKDEDSISYIDNIFKDKFKVQPWKEEWKNSISVRVGGTSLIRFLEANNLKKKSSEFAFIPVQILTGSKESLCAFLRGIFEADGSITQGEDGSKVCVTVHSISEQFVRDIHIALLSLGIIGKLEKVKHSDGHWGEKCGYRINITEKEEIIKYRNKIGFISSRKQLRLNSVEIKNEKLCSRKQKLIAEAVDFDPSGFYFDEVKEIRKSNNLTFDISVPDGNTYISNGFVSHNSVIVISTSNGIGNWYWKTWTDAKDGYNDFNPIQIDWWDMDWAIEYIDDISNSHVRIAPADHIETCQTKENKDKYGDFCSPWLIKQRNQLTEKGNDSKFRQEVLRDFLGSGNTVLSRETLLTIRQQSSDHGKKFKTLNHVDYVHPINGESYNLDFQDNLWIWEEPQKNHIYALGADISSGEATDWSAIEVFDVSMGVQVAELQIKVKPKMFSIMIDYIGRWYNSAFVVPERTGMGVTVCQDLDELSYPSIFRKNMMPSANKKKMINRNSGPIGYPTTGMGKPILDKAMIDYFGETGYLIKSHRLVSQAETYVHLGPTKTGAEKGTMNDDLMIAAGLAFVGINLAVSRDSCTLLPFMSANMNFSEGNSQEITKTNDFNATCPVSVGKDQTTEQIIGDEMIKYTNTLLSPLTDSNLPNVIHKKNVLKKHGK